MTGGKSGIPSASLPAQAGSGQALSACGLQDDREKYEIIKYFQKNKLP